MIEPYEANAKRNHDQTLAQLHARGGLDPVEVFLVMNGLRWTDPRPGTQDCVDWLARQVEKYRGVERLEIENAKYRDAITRALGQLDCAPQYAAVADAATILKEVLK